MRHQSLIDRIETLFMYAALAVVGVYVIAAVLVLVWVGAK